MILRIISLYTKTKQGVRDPEGFAVDEIHDAFFGFFLIPGLILLAVVIILGLLGYSSLITEPSSIAVGFFWLFTVVLLGYGMLVVLLRRLLDVVIRNCQRVVHEIKNEIK